MRHRTIPLLITLLAAAPAVAQQLPHTPAQSQPLGPTGGAIRQQPLDGGGSAAASRFRRRPARRR